MKLAKDLREFIELLNSRGVEYLVVGGHAVAWHGHPRFTGDIDFFVRSSETNALRLIDVLEAFGFGGLGIEASTFQRPNQVVQLGRPPNRIDLLSSISGVEFDEAWPARELAHMDGLPVPMLGRAALVANKRASGRLKDLADLEALGDLEPPA